MESSNINICMNEACKATTSSGEWKKGWVLKSSGLATLCNNCGSAYENSIFCETFHREDSGWRECKFCGKHIHCGCIASKSLHDYLDFGGVGCLSCIKFSETQLIRQIQTPSDDIFGGLGTLAAICDPQSSVIENYMEGNIVTKGKLGKLSKNMEESQPNGHNLFLQSQKGEQNLSSVQTKKAVNMLPRGEAGTGISHFSQQSNQFSIISKQDANPQPQGPKDMYESLAQPSLKFSISAPLSTSNTLQLSPGEVVEGREKSKVPPFQQGQRSRQILPKSSKSGIAVRAQGSNGAVSQTRVARPPVEGRGRSQLLPRYWPRITDQELQKICGDLNSTIVPLFEKVLSASDAGRIGRLVLPKACAEAYFPPINQSEGVPIRMKDIKGKEWTFQFRFWPNNNSRMYVLEGVTPCIQNMQLQAGDTVTFSRIDPEGMLVMGCRKAANSVDMQDSSTPTLPNGGGTADDLVSAVKVDQPTDAFDWMRKEEQRGQINGESTQQQMGQPEKKKSRIIGSKSKRLLMHNEDANELQITWEEAQELLRPFLSARPTIVMVDNHEFEEYEDPPLIGKKTIFMARESGCLTLQNVLLQTETCHLLRNSKLEALVVQWIKSKEQVEGVCKLLSQNIETLASLRFNHCKLSSEFVNAICESLLVKDLATHGIQHFTFNTSRLLEADSISIPAGLNSFLSSSRCLCTADFRDCELQQNSARMIFSALFNASSNIASLDLSENNISGWLSHFKWKPSSHLHVNPGICTLKSLCVLKLRGNNLQKDDADCLNYALFHMPNLETLDLCDNPIADDGIMTLMPYFTKMAERITPLVDLNLEECKLTCHGVKSLLQVLSSFKKPLNSLRIGDNNLGSEVGVQLGKFICTGIKELHFHDIGINSFGFVEAQKQITAGLKLVFINIRGNSGGVGAAKFISKLIMFAPELVKIDASYNVLPAEAVPIISSSLETAKGKLRHLDLAGNALCSQPASIAMLEKYVVDGHIDIVLPGPNSSTQFPYDDDP